MARKSVAVRSSEQRGRQQRLWVRQKVERRSGPDDVARVALHWMIARAIKVGAKEKLDDILNEFVGPLVEQGFGEAATCDVLDALVARYGGHGWGFRRKPHLLFIPDVGPED